MTSDVPCGPRVAPGTLLVDVLGSGCAVPDARRDTTSLLVGTTEGWTLLDCPGAVVHKLARRGLHPRHLARVVLTHDHVDHVYGFPHLLDALGVSGCRAPLEVVAPAQTLETLRALVRVHRLDGDRHPGLRCVEISCGGESEMAVEGATRLRFAPTAHSRATIAVRIEFAGVAMCHSSDTRPSDAVVRLSLAADILFHDCGGPHRRRALFEHNHCSALEAGRAAARARVGKLVLLHLGVSADTDVEECVAEARREFDGNVSVATDGARWCVGGTGEVGDA